MCRSLAENMVQHGGVSLADKADSGVLLVADHADDVVLLQLHQRLSILDLLDLFLVANVAFLRLRVQVLVQVGVLYS